MTKLFTKLTVILLCLMLLAGCAQQGQGAAKKTVTVTDGLERTVEVPADCKRIVVLSAAEVEIVCELGAEDRLVGRGTYCNYPESVANIQAVGSGSETNPEEIIALTPDLVIMNTMDQSKDVVDLLEKSGIPTVLTTATDIEGVYHSIEIIGKALSLDEKAKSVIDSMKADFAKVPNLGELFGENKTIYFEISPLEWGLWSAGGGTFYEQIAAAMGMENLFNDLDSWAQVSEEQVISRDPAVIVALTSKEILGKDPVEEICSREGWKDLSAVKDGLVVYYDADALSRPGPRLGKAAVGLAEMIAEIAEALDKAA